MRVRPTESHANPVAPCQWEHERIDYNPKHALIPPVKGGNDSVLGRSPGRLPHRHQVRRCGLATQSCPYGRWPMPPSSVEGLAVHVLEVGSHS